MANSITSLIGRLKKGTRDVADAYTTRVKANYTAIRDELRDAPAQADKIIQGGNVYKDTFGYKNPQGLAQKSANAGLGLLDNIGSASLRGVVNTGKGAYDLGRLGYGMATGTLAEQAPFRSREEYLGLAKQQTGDAFRFGGTVTPFKSVQALKTAAPSIGLYSGLEGGLNVLNDKSNKSMRMKFAEGAVSGLERGVPMAGVGVVSNPLISKAMDKRFTTLGKLAVGVPANITEGYAMNKSAGMDYTKEDALIDALVPGGLVLGKTSIDSIKNAIAGGVKSKKITPEVAKNLEGYLYKNGRKYWNVRNGTGYARKEDVKKLTPYNTVKTYFTKQKISDINTGNTEQFRKFLADNPELAAFAPISTPEITYDENGKMQFKQGEYNLGERALAFGALKGIRSGAGKKIADDIKSSFDKDFPKAMNIAMSVSGNAPMKSTADDVINAFKKGEVTTVAKSVGGGITEILDDMGKIVARSFDPQSVKLRMTKGTVAEGAKVNIRSQAKNIADFIEKSNKPNLDINELRDIGNYGKGLKDVYRNFERVFGKTYPKVAKMFIEPFEGAKSRFYDMQDVYLDDLEKTIVNGLGIKKGSRLSALVQEYGEKKIPLAELQRMEPKNWQKIVDADTWFRSKYDELINQVNATRKALYPNNPEKLVPFREDYYRHFKEFNEGLGGLMNIFDTPANIDPALAGLSDFTQPKLKFLSMAQRRLGDKSDIDAVGGFNWEHNQSSKHLHSSLNF